MNCMDIDDVDGSDPFSDAGHGAAVRLTADEARTLAVDALDSFAQAELDE